MPEPLFGPLPPVPLEPEIARQPRAAAPGRAEFSRVLAELGRDADRGQALLERTLHGARALDAAELIALQAGIYRFSESIDLIAKVVDRAGQAVRTVMNGSGA